MKNNFLIYGANGYVGEAITRLAVKRGYQPIIAGRNESQLKQLADQLNLKFLIFNLSEKSALDNALKDVLVVLNCAGPYLHTYKPMIAACLRQSTHYVDITGEIPVYEAIAALDNKAKEQGIMMLPGAGFDVVPTDCIAVYLKDKLPSATHLSLAFQSVGPSRLPPGTMKTMIELVPYGERIRKDGKLIEPKETVVTRTVDFGEGNVKVTRLSWGDVFTGFYSTGIPNIEVFTEFPESVMKQIRMTRKFNFLFGYKWFRNYLMSKVRGGASKEKRDQTHVNVWGEVKDGKGNRASCRLTGPEAGLNWTSQTAVAAVSKILQGNFKLGYQTPAMAFGADFVLECDGVKRIEN